MNARLLTLAANARRQVLAHHKFKVGQLVDFVPSRLGMPTSGRQYEVVRQLPAEAGEFQYRVKSRGETFERMAKESELSRRSSP